MENIVTRGGEEERMEEGRSSCCVRRKGKEKEGAVVFGGCSPLK